MPALFPLAFLIAEPALCRLARAGAGRAPRRWPPASAWPSSICLVAVGVAATRYDRDNTALAQALRDARAPGDPVVFVEEYFFDVPLHARLREPVPVIADWHDPDIVKRDNWNRELAEAAPFAPERAAGAARRRAAGLSAALRQGAALGRRQERSDEPIVAALPDAIRVAATHHAELWRIAPRACTGPESAP